MIPGAHSQGLEMVEPHLHAGAFEDSSRRRSLSDGELLDPVEAGSKKLKTEFESDLNYVIGKDSEVDIDIKVNFGAGRTGFNGEMIP